MRAQFTEGTLFKKATARMEFSCVLINCHMISEWIHLFQPPEFVGEHIKISSIIEVYAGLLSGFHGCFPTKHNKKNNIFEQQILFCYLRLFRSRSSVSKSSSGWGMSLGPCEWSTEELEEITVVCPEGWIVLNWNWGPIHRRLWGPVWVTISTCKN